MLRDATGPVRFLENGLRDRERRMGLVDRERRWLHGHPHKAQ